MREAPSYGSKLNKKGKERKASECEHASFYFLICPDKSKPSQVPATTVKRCSHHNVPIMTDSTLRPQAKTNLSISCFSSNI